LGKEPLSLEIAMGAQTFSQRCDEVKALASRSGVQKPDHQHRRLLRPRGERPRGSRAAEHPKKFAPPHAPLQVQEMAFYRRKRVFF
jgi:hypothetical protein